MIYALTFILAFCSLIYELLLAQSLSILVINSVFVYSVVIGLYLASMGAGAIACNRLIRAVDPWERLFQVEMGLSILGGLCVLIVQGAHMIFSFFWVKSLSMTMELQSLTQHLAELLFLLIVFATVIVIGFLSGLELPILLKLGKQDPRKGGQAHVILAADYFGSLVAGIGFPLILLPRFDVMTISFMVALLNLLTAGFLFKYYPRKNTAMAGLGIGFMILTVFFINLDEIRQYFLKKYYYYRLNNSLTELLSPRKDLPDIEHQQSFYQEIDIVQRVSYNNPLTDFLLDQFIQRAGTQAEPGRKKELFINREFQFSADTLEIYHEYFAHIPIMFEKTPPKKILILGAGDGLLLKELLKYRHIQEVTLVEIDPAMIELARRHPAMSQLNGGAFEDQRVKVIVADAYHFVRLNQEKFDAVYLDFPDPSEYNVSKLYSREFYTFVKSALTEHGYIVMDTGKIDHFLIENDQFLLADDNPWLIYYNTLRAAGFAMLQPYSVQLEEDSPAIQDAVSREIYRIVSLGKDKEFVDAYHFMVKQIGHEAIVNGVIKAHVSLLRQGFIFAKKEKSGFDRQYVDFGVDFAVLNEERFQRALQLPFAQFQTVMPSKVNSIMRPTLPMGSNAMRLPY